MCLGIFSSILKESHEGDHVCILRDFNATPGSPRFNEICDILHENNILFRDTDILPDNTYSTHMLIMVAIHVHGWIILQCPMFCPSLLLTAAPSRMLPAQIIVQLVTLNFDRLPMTQSIGGQKSKHINRTFEDAGLKSCFYQR